MARDFLTSVDSTVAVRRREAPSKGRAHPPTRRRRRFRRHSRRAAVQPLYEALSSGLGCDAIGYQFSERPEWG